MHSPSHPGPVLRDLWLDGGSESAAAERLGIDPDEFAQLLDGDRPITAKIALKLEDAGWSNGSFWMRQQAYYDLAQARSRNAQRWDVVIPGPEEPVTKAGKESAPDADD